jgi:putative ABC transport system permease protein
MTLLLSAWTLGLLLALLALGVYITFRLFSFPDITVDGSFPLGGALAAVLMTGGPHQILSSLNAIYLWPAAWIPAAGAIHPIPASLLGMLGGALAGACTGVLHTRFRINGLLAGILVMTALYSVNLFVLGKSNQPLQNMPTLATYAGDLADAVAGEETTLQFLIWEFGAREVAVLVLSLLLVGAVGVLLYVFFRTELGTAMRATGDNAQMITALGVDTRNMTTLGLALSNGLVALAGALFAQVSGYADVQMGIGMVVSGLASVIIGEALVGSRQLGLALIGSVMGSVLFRLLNAMVLLAGLNPNYMKFFNAVFVFLALVLPGQMSRLRALWR